jgi:transcriptional regulator with XRE-family HTH domain
MQWPVRRQLAASMSKRSPDPIDVNLGKRIKMRRAMLHLSQSDLGEACGVTFQQIQKYEKGLNRVGASRLQQFSKLLDVPVSFFFEGLPPSGAEKQDEPEDLAQQLLATRYGIKLAKAFMSIDDKSLRRSIVAIVEGIAKAAPRSVRK